MYSVSCAMYNVECIPTSTSTSTMYCIHACMRIYMHTDIRTYGGDASGGSKPLNLMIKSCLQRKWYLWRTRSCRSLHYKYCTQITVVEPSELVQDFVHQLKVCLIDCDWFGIPHFTKPWDKDLPGLTMTSSMIEVRNCNCQYLSWLCPAIWNCTGVIIHRYNMILVPKYSVYIIWYTYVYLKQNTSFNVLVGSSSFWYRHVCIYLASSKYQQAST